MNAMTDEYVLQARLAVTRAIALTIAYKYATTDDQRDEAVIAIRAALDSASAALHWEGPTS